MANGFVTPTPPVDFDPGFVQAPSPAAEGTQTFGTSFTAKPQPFGAYGAPTGGFAGAPAGGFAGSFAPVGPGQSATSTVPTISDVSASSDSGLGTAAAVGGGAALAALLSRQGSDGSDGGGMSFSSIIGGAQKVYKLAEMAGKDLSELVPEGMQELIDKLNPFSGPEVPTDVGQTMPSPEQFARQDILPKDVTPEMQQIGPEAASPDPLQASKELAESIQTTPLSPASVAYQANIASMFPGAATSTAALQSAVAAQIPGQSLASLSAAGMDIGSMGGALAGVTSTAAAAPVVGAAYAGTAGIAGGSVGVGSAIAGGGQLAVAAAPLMGAIPVLGLVAFGAMRMAAHKDPTADARSAQMIENDLQRLAKKTGADKEAGLEEFEEKIWDNPGVLNLMNKAANGGDLAFGAKATSGGTKVIGYSPNISNFVKENQERLQAVVKQKEKAYETVGGDSGTAPPPNPYRKKKVQIDEAAIAAGMMDDPRKKKPKVDPWSIP